MVLRILFLMMCCGVVLISPQPCIAQNKVIVPAFTPFNNNDLYRTRYLGQQVVWAWNKDVLVDFAYLRSLYPYMTVYDPSGSQTHERLTRLAFVADTDERESIREKAIYNFKYLAREHTAHIGIISYARDLVSGNPALGDLETYDFILSGLRRSIIRSGNGEKLFTGFQIYNFAEEDVILAHLNVTPLSAKTNLLGSTHYTIHTVYDPKFKKQYPVFIRHSSMSEIVDEHFREFKDPRLME